MTAPWERLPHEPARAYELFVIYRDLPPHERSLRRLAEIVRAQRGIEQASPWRPGNLFRLCCKYRWVERATAWDEELDRRRREAALREIVAITERHRRICEALQQKAMEKLSSMNVDELSSSDVLRYALEAIRLERQLVEEWPWLSTRGTRSDN